MAKYNDLSIAEQTKLKAAIKKLLDKSHQQNQAQNNQHNNSYISDAALIGILQIAITYNIIEEKCLENTCYKNKIRYSAYSTNSAEEATDQILQVFQNFPTVIEAAVDEYWEESLANTEYTNEHDNKDEWDMEP